MAIIQHPIDTTKHLPENVFIGEWSAYLFFDSDWVFSSEFIEFCNIVMKQDAVHEVEITDLDDPESTFSINSDISWQNYLAFLNGRDFDGWLYDVHRFAVSTANQDWCIYLERDAEIAVFACKGSCGREALSFVMHKFKALSVEKMVETENTVAFHRRLAKTGFALKLVQSYALPPLG